MSTNSERIAANNTRLSALVETANALPDAGDGGTVETCTLTTGSILGCICATVYEDGEYGVLYDGGDYVPFTINSNSIVCGSCICIQIGQNWILSYTGLELLTTSTMWGSTYIFRVTAAAGETATITATSDF